VQIRQLVTAQELTGLCHGAQKWQGEAGGLGSCDSFFGDATIAKLTVALQQGSAEAMTRQRTAARQRGASVQALALDGVDEAFQVLLRDGDAPYLFEIWSRTGHSIVHLEAEAELCSQDELTAILNQVVHRLRGVPAAHSQASRHK
jgi:hypothetical protein